jgi:co-chaperonin GroES (HSP10)
MTPAAEISELDKDIAQWIRPTGYRLLVRIPPLSEEMKMHENLLMPDERRRLEEVAQQICKVLAMGPDAYTSQAKFPTGPWCEVGDDVMIRSYAGTRVVIKGAEYRLINDDTVQAVIKGDPTEIERAQ